MPVGLYISVPFCPSKCSYCNFASDVFSRSLFQRYVDRVCSDMKRDDPTLAHMGGRTSQILDSIYLGGGTPTVLDMEQLRRLFVAISQNFEVQADAEVTVECAPGTLTPAVIQALRDCGVNRASLGVQSFVDREAAAVGRLHTRTIVLEDIDNLRRAGITNINIDLIAGLPQQTIESWAFSVDAVIASQVPHASVYLLEVDEDSRLGRELIAGGARYHAHSVPNEDLIADFYLMACERLEAAGGRQYEISNFSRRGYESRHNLKYWTRKPYLGFGVDAHSMLPVSGGAVEAVRLSWPDSLEAYLGKDPQNRSEVSSVAALEETFFLGLRLNRGIDLREVAVKFGEDPVAGFRECISEFTSMGLMEKQGEVVRLTARGRLLSNEVFQRFMSLSIAPA